MNTYNFNALGAINECVDWIKTYAEGSGMTKVVLGISGGKDSTIAAALCCRALGSENVHGLLLPNGIQSDIQDSIDVCTALDMKYDTVNIKPMYDAFVLQYNLFLKDKGGADVSDDALINLAPRVRMTMIRLWGQSNHHRMCGTGNYSEITVGYCTKDGDTCFDFNPLARLTSIEVVEMGLKMKEIPRQFVVKTPSDGLCGLSDEEKLGVSYSDIHKYIRSIPMDSDTWTKINKLERLGLHKRTSGAPIYIPSDKILGKDTSGL